MLKVTKNTLPKSQLDLVIEVSADEMKPFLEKAAAQLSEQKPIKGFRPGHAPLDTVISTYGEMAVWQVAADLAVGKTYYDALEQEKLLVIGSPHIHVEKIAPGNDFVYKATVTVYPDIELPDFEKIEVKRKEANAKDEQIDKVLGDLADMRATEVVEKREAKDGDKVVIDFDIQLDGVSIEGGSQKKYPLILGKKTMIPGFEEGVVGMKAGEEKTFDLTFPEDYHAKHLAGKPTKATIKLEEVYKRELPTLDDEFAKTTMNVETLEKLKETIRENIEHEEKHKADHEATNEMFDKLADAAKISEIPELLVNNELNKMILELEQNVSRQGMNFDDYLTSIGKSRANLKIDFADQAVKRVKIALINRELAKRENLEATDEEVQHQIDLVLQQNPDNKELAENAKTKEYKEYVRNILSSTKALDWLKEKIIK